jgi:hypothetical protein
MNRVGKSRKARLQAKWGREQTEFWSKHPIETCELRFDGCLKTHGLAPAHSKDRGDCWDKWRSDEENEADFKEVVAACSACHWHADREMPKEERLRIFKEVIARRVI